MPHSLDTRRLAEIFEGIKSHDVSAFSTWEIDFIESVESQWKAGRSLSEKQLEVLERIWMKV